MSFDIDVLKEKNIRNLTFTTPQTSPDKSFSDWLRVIVGNQSEHTRHIKLGSVLEYKYKHKRNIFLLNTLQTVQVRF